MTVRLRTDQSGYTMIEMLMSISITGVLLLAAGTFVTNGILGANVEYNRTVVQSNTKSAVEQVAQSIRSARSVEANNSQPDLNPPVEGNAYSWSSSSGSGATLILAVPAHDTNGNLMYADGLHTSLYTNDIIFYLDSATHRLYRRTLANAVPGNAAKSTCPPAIATPSCPADSIIVEDIAGLSIQFYDDDNAPISTPSGTEAVGYSVTETKKIGNRSYTGTYQTVAALRNR